MKSTIFMLCLCCCFWSCKSDTANTNSDVASKPGTGTAAKAAETSPTHVKSDKSALMLGMWHYAIALGNPKEAPKYKGRWIDIKRDDTFTSGIYLEENNSGTWSYDGEKKIIRLKFKQEEDIASEWETQGDGETIIWKGSTPYNKTGTQIKMEKQLDGGKPGK